MAASASAAPATSRPSTRRAARMTATSILLAALVAVLAFCCPTTVNAAALTTIVHPGETSCYYAWVDQVGEKVGWYFAVQSGGNFEINWAVSSPSHRLVMDGKNERQIDIIFTGQEVGEYSFCFEDPTMSAEKMVDFDITVESEPRLTMPLNQIQLLKEHSAPLEDSIAKVRQKLTSIARTQRYFRTWENRGFDTVRSTQSKLFYFSFLETLLIIAISFGQVSLIRYLFDARGTKRYRV